MRAIIHTRNGVTEAKNQVEKFEDREAIYLSLIVGRECEECVVLDVVAVVEDWITSKDLEWLKKRLQSLTITFEKGKENKVDSLLSIYQVINTLSVYFSIELFSNNDDSIKRIHSILKNGVQINEIMFYVSAEASHSISAVEALVTSLEQNTMNTKIGVFIKGEIGDELPIEELVRASKNQNSSIRFEVIRLSRESLNRFKRNLDILYIHFWYDRDLECLEFYPNTGFADVDIHFQEFEKFLFSIASQERLRKINFLDVDASLSTPLLDTVANFLAEYSNVYEVKINNEHLKNYNERASQLHEEYLKPALCKALEHLITNRQEGDYNQGKVMVLGQGGAGKTSTLRSISGQKFNPRHDKTLVADNLKIIDTDGDNFDLVGEKEEGFISGLAAMSAGVFKKGIPLVSNDNTTKRSIRVIPELIMDKGVAVAKEQSRRNEEQSFSRDLRRSVKDVTFSSLRNHIKFSWWDFGGQRVFDAVHSLYLSDGGILLYIFNLKRLLEKEEETLERIRTWLISIQLYSNHCQVLFIGTHAEDARVKGNIEAANLLISELQDDHHELSYVEYHENNLRFFPVENSMEDNTYLGPIKAEIRRISTDPTLQMTWTRKVELSWMFFMHTFYFAEKNAISFSELLARAREGGFSVNEAISMINFFSSAGEILSFRESIGDDTTLSVILKPKWLLEVLASLICCRENDFKDDLEQIRRKKKGRTGQLITLLRKHRILSKSLLYMLLFKRHEITEEEFKLLVKVCERNLIIAEIKNIPRDFGIKKKKVRNEETFWLVPSFFVAEADEKDLKILQMEKEPVPSKPMKIKKIEWSELAPHSLFGKFVCGVIQAGRKADRSYFKVLHLSGTCLRCSLEEHLFEVSVENTTVYLLKLNSTEESFIEAVTSIIKMAYESVQLLERIGDKVVEEDCEFFNENLNSNKDEIKIERAINKQPNKIWWDVFLSHTWANGNHARVVALCKRLEAAGLTCWLDTKDMEGHMVDAMVRGINQSYAFLALITKEYLKAANNPNSNAGKELNFASKIGAEYIIVVVLDESLLDQKIPEWKNSAVLFHLSQSLYIDFSSSEKVEENIDKLLTAFKKIKQLRG